MTRECWSCSCKKVGSIVPAVTMTRLSSIITLLHLSWQPSRLFPSPSVHPLPTGKNLLQLARSQVRPSPLNVRDEVRVLTLRIPQSQPVSPSTQPDHPTSLRHVVESSSVHSQRMMQLSPLSTSTSRRQRRRRMALSFTLDWERRARQPRCCRWMPRSGR